MNMNEEKNITPTEEKLASEFIELASSVDQEHQNIILPKRGQDFIPPHRKRSRVSPVVLGAMMGLAGMAFSPREPKPLRKCLLKRCEKMHNHNGGYCCAEHCKEDSKKVDK